MSIHIDSDEVCAMIRAGAARTGQDPTDMVEAAVRQYLNTLEKGRRHTVADEMVSRCDEVLTPEAFDAFAAAPFGESCDVQEISLRDDEAVPA